MNHLMKTPRGSGLRRTGAMLALLVALATSGCAMAYTDVRQSHGDIVEFGSNVNIPADQIVNGDVVDFGGNVDVHGRVMGSVVVFGGDLHIYPEGEVRSDTVAFGGEIKNESRATPSQLHGKTVPPVETSPPETIPMPDEPGSVSHVPGWGPVWASILVPDLLLTLLVFFLFPVRMRNVEEHLIQQPLVSMLLGFVAPIVLVIALIVLLALVVTWPLIPVAIVAYFVAYWIGKAAVASFLGRRLLEAAKVADPQPLASVAVGLAVLLIVTLPTPIWFAIGMFSIVGALATGAALLSFMKTRPGGPAYVLVPPGQTPAAAYTPPAGPAASGPPAIPQ